MASGSTGDRDSDASVLSTRTRSFHKVMRSIAEPGYVAGHQDRRWYGRGVENVGYRRFNPEPASGPGVGDVAPGFELRWTFDEGVSLGHLLGRGPVVLVFYVFDFGHV